MSQEGEGRRASGDGPSAAAEEVSKWKLGANGNAKIIPGIHLLEIICIIALRRSVKQNTSAY